MSNFFTYKKDDSIGLLCFKREDIDSNVLSEAVLKELDQHLDSISASADISGLVIYSGNKKQFIAGADIKEIEHFKTAEQATEGASKLQEIFNKLENLKNVTTVVAIHGPCMGGGTELSLACDYRVMSESDSTHMSLPEIQLGLIPGAGGTQRLPRLIGIQAALDLILTGKKVNARKAQKLGLADAAAHEKVLLEVAKQFATKKPRSSEKAFDIKQAALEGNALGRKIVEKKAKEMVDKTTKGFYPAAYKALDAVFYGMEKGLKKGLQREAEHFGFLAMSSVSDSLVHLFHATTALKKNRFKEALENSEHSKKTDTIGVIGAGFMGAGIATVCADKSKNILLSDPNPNSIAKALQSTHEYFKKKLKKKRIKPFEIEKNMMHISPGLTTKGFENCDVIIEAVFEDVKLKQKILSELENQNHKDFIFASNTSAIPIHEIAAKSKDPGRVIGMHFFSPVEKMPLLEIVITDKTEDWVTAKCVQLGQAMNKQVIVVKDGPGFYTTRALAFFLNEAALMLEEGHKIEAIDKALTGIGFPVGPIALIDEVGIDVSAHVLDTIEAAFPDRISKPKALTRILEAGMLGRKNQKGFYKYQNDKKAGSNNDIYQYFDTGKKSTSSNNLARRCLLLFINESFRCLEEGVLSKADDGDVGAVFGLGFPPFLGGPFHYARAYGVNKIIDELKDLEKDFGARFKPCEQLLKLKN